MKYSIRKIHSIIMYRWRGVILHFIIMRLGKKNCLGKELCQNTSKINKCHNTDIIGM